MVFLSVYSASSNLYVPSKMSDSKQCIKSLFVLEFFISFKICKASSKWLKWTKINAKGMLNIIVPYTNNSSLVKLWILKY